MPMPPREARKAREDSTIERPARKISMTDGYAEEAQNAESAEETPAEEAPEAPAEEAPATEPPAEENKDE